MGETTESKEASVHQLQYMLRNTSKQELKDRIIERILDLEVL